MTDTPMPPSPTHRKKRYRRAIGPRLTKLLSVVFFLFALLMVNSIYLLGIRFLEWRTGETHQDYFYLLMFLGHLGLGMLILLPVILFGLLHLRNTHNRPNRRAVKVGIGLFVVSLVLLFTGLALTRIEGVFELKNPGLRSTAYWLHVITPLVAAWLFILHRLAGKRIRWRVGANWAAVGVVFAVVLIGVHALDPRDWNVEGPESGEQYFFPSLARTATGSFIPAETMMMDDYCMDCHGDVHERWSFSAHRFASFNNPAYLFSVRNTREAAMDRDGNVQASRFCAGCHDLVPFFSGAFDDPDFDDVNHPTAQAGITCTGCHAITHVNSTRGNADYTIEEPIHYPFAFSDNGGLQWVNRQLVKAKPDFHKKTFLKPLHETAEFCSACHKVHLPEELNAYKWLRGQNHYDSYLLSGVSGHGASSFYYPPKAEHDCSGCHLPLLESDDFAADFFDDSGKLKIHDHLFPSANTGIAAMLEMPGWVIEEHQKFLTDITRIDIFGVKEGGAIDGMLTAPIRPEIPTLEPGKTYLVETVVRTTKLGHLLTQGTADSNELWVDVTATSGGDVVGRSGGRNHEGRVDPWSHFVNAYVLDRHGNRVDRRNAEDIFIPLYNNQIPPGAADVLHYRIEVPEDAAGSLTVEAKLQYRKFDTTYMQHVHGEDYVNELPVTTMCADTVTFPVAGGSGETLANQAALAGSGDMEIPLWQRWNDYGIGLLRKGSSGSSKGELRQAEYAFARVEELGRADGALNVARVYFKEGRLEDAAAALKRAGEADPQAWPWVIDWFTGLVNYQNGFLDEAIENFTAIIETQYPDARAREFDFSQDRRVLEQLATTLYDRAKQERGEERRAQREALLREAVKRLEEALVIDSESATAHYLLGQIYARLEEHEKAAGHNALHAKYKVDDNARDQAIAAHRIENPAADHAAEAIVIYDLQRMGAFELNGAGRSTGMGMPEEDPATGMGMPDTGPATGAAMPGEEPAVGTGLQPEELREGE